MEEISTKNNSNISEVGASFNLDDNENVAFYLASTVWESTFVFWSRKVGNFILHRIESNQLSISRNGKIQNVLFQTMENNQQSIF